MTRIFRNAWVTIVMFGFAALLQAAPITYDFNFGDTCRLRDYWT
jgi:hypothetical protein